jgi:hypothetical protein
MPAGVPAPATGGSANAAERRVVPPTIPATGSTAAADRQIQLNKNPAPPVPRPATGSTAAADRQIETRPQNQRPNPAKPTQNYSQARQTRRNNDQNGNVSRDIQNNVTGNARIGQNNYTIQSGDTLGEVARAVANNRTGTPASQKQVDSIMRQLKQRNNIGNSSQIRAGSNLDLNNLNVNA